MDDNNLPFYNPTQRRVDFTISAQMIYMVCDIGTILKYYEQHLELIMSNVHKLQIINEQIYHEIINKMAMVNVDEQQTVEEMEE